MRIFLVVLLSLCALVARAQRGSFPDEMITGRVVTEQGNAVMFANVALYALDSSLVGGTSTDENGAFELPARPGTYDLLITFLSFEPRRLQGLVKQAQRPLALGVITLQADAQLLEEVEISAERSQVEFMLDKRVFNVGQDLANSGGNAADILANVPSVDVDIEGNVSLRGSENVRILIDGKPSGLVGNGNAEALRMLQAGMIEKIEVITNPSSKYEAEGEVGIINIVLKKEKQKGFNGSFEVKTGYPDNHGASFSVNYRRKWINMFASSGLNYRRSPGRGGSYQRYDGPDTTYLFESDRTHVRGGLSTVNRVGADIFLNDQNTLTAALLYKYADGKNTASLAYRDLGSLNEVLQTTLRQEDENEVSEDIELSLLHLKTFAKKGHQWTTDLRLTQNDDTEKASLVQSSSTAPDAFQRSSNTEDERTLTFQSDYTYPFGKEGKFETGARASLREIENIYSVDLRANDTADWMPLNAFTDQLTYTENIYAAYAMMGNQWQKLSIQAGLRAEYTDIETRLSISNVSNPRNYFNLFPSAHMSYKLSASNSVQMSYSRRISRPSFRELIPFFSYTDPRFFYGGNPDLNPEYTDSYEFGLLRMIEKGSLLGSVYYRHTTNVVQRITLTDTTGLIRTIPVNLGTQDAYGVEFNVNYNLAKWWRINGSANVYYASIQGVYRERNYGTELFTMMARGNTTFTLAKTYDLQASVRYHAPSNTPQGKRLSVSTLDLGISRDLFKGNGTLVFNVSDVFNSGLRRSVVDTEYLYSESRFQWRVRQFQLTFNYRINQKKQRGGGRSGGSEDMGGDGF
jgi:outer membrane receptor protein involved in Fe transport